MFNIGEKVYCKSMDRNLVIAHNEGEHAYCCIDISYERFGSKVFDSFILSDHDLESGWKEKDIHNENNMSESNFKEHEFMEERIKEIIEILDYMESDMYYHNWSVYSEVYGGLTLEDIVLINRVLHKEVGIESDSYYDDIL